MAHPEKKRSFAPLFWVAGIALFILAIYFIRTLTRETLKVRVASVSYRTLSSVVPTNGRVEPVEQFQAHAPAPGVVRKIFVNEGDRVSVGELLVKMDDADIRSHLATAEAQLSQARLQLSEIEHGGTHEELGQFRSNTSTATLEQKQAQANLDAVKTLHQRGSASASEVAAAQQRLDAANLAMQNATSHSTARYNADERTNAAARVQDAQASVQAAHAALAAADIRSPYAGTVYSIPVSEFDFVHDGEDLMDVADLTRLQVRAYFDEPRDRQARRRATRKDRLGCKARPGMARTRRPCADNHHHLRRHPQRRRMPYQRR